MLFYNIDIVLDKKYILTLLVNPFAECLFVIFHPKLFLIWDFQDEI